jgi:hypothetical protein
LLSTLDWALIETWKDAGIPLEAVLRGIDSTFDTYDRRPVKTKKINSLAYCSQEVLAAAEDMKEAAVGATRASGEAPGLESTEISAFLRQNAARLLNAASAPQLQGHAAECANTLNTLAGALDEKSAALRLEDLERHLTVLEEKLTAALTISAPDSVLLAARTEADREIAPYRSKMPAAQIEQLQKQFIHKRLFEQFKIPRLSLFYM